MLPQTLVIASGRSAILPQSATVGGSRGAGIANPGDPGYCTWGAWNLAPWLGSSVSGNARNWYNSAKTNGLPTGTTPVVGAVFVWVEGTYGHVGVVTSVQSPTAYISNEMNGGNLWTDFASAKTNEFGKYVTHTHSTNAYTYFIYQPGTQPGAYVGHIVQWGGDTKAQRTAWMVGPDGKRRWIPTIAIYSCLKAHAVPGPDVLGAAVLAQYADLTGQWETCSSSGFGAGAGQAPVEPGSPGDVSPPTTVAPPPPSYPQPVFPVQNTAETPPDGVYFRNSPHTSDTSRVTGLGVYTGERIELLCYGWGDSVGQYGDALWYEVANVTRPNVAGVANAGWLNAHYVDDGRAANQADSGVSPCPGYAVSPPAEAPAPVPTPAPAPVPAPQAAGWSETPGGVTHTWTNYSNAGGDQGPSIQTGQTVQVSCKVPGFAVADGDTWWYRIASGPWNNVYYASADAFYNNGATTGSLHGTPFVDASVANC